MSEQIITILKDLFGNAYALIIFLGSAIPITEQRATIPLGIYWNLPPLEVLLLALAGSYLPVPLLLLFFRKVLEWLHTMPKLQRFTAFLDQKIQKNVQRFEKSTELALIIFVAIPLPGTGLWTGSAVASFLGFNLKKSLICILLGGIISAVGLTLLSVFIKNGIAFF